MSNRISSPEATALAQHHTAVFIDHKEARVFQIHAAETDETTVTASLQHVHHNHPKGGEHDKEHPDDAKRFFQAVERSLEGTGEILVVGPSTAKLEFMKYVREHAPLLGRRVVGVETVDHPTDGQLVSHAKKYFHLSDRIL